MRLSKRQLSSLIKEALKERVELFPSRGVDEDNVSEAMRDAKEAVRVFEGQLKLYLEHNPMQPDEYTGLIKKLKRLDVEYLKLLATIASELGLEANNKGTRL